MSSLCNFHQLYKIDHEMIWEFHIFDPEDISTEYLKIEKRYQINFPYETIQFNAA